MRTHTESREYQQRQVQAKDASLEDLVASMGNAALEEERKHKEVKALSSDQ